MKVICENCGTLGEAKTVTKGSLGVEVLLWFFFCLPGLIYSVWRLTTRGKACGHCGSDRTMPPDSPRGRELMAKYAPRVPGIPPTLPPGAP